MLEGRYHSKTLVTKELEISSHVMRKVLTEIRRSTVDIRACLTNMDVQ